MGPVATTTVSAVAVAAGSTVFVTFEIHNARAAFEEWQAKLSRVEERMSQAERLVETLRRGTDMTPEEGSE